MSLLDNLKSFNNTVDKIKSAKDNVHDLTDKSKLTDEDRSCIRKAKIWSLINLILLIPFGVALYCIFKFLFLSELFMLGVFAMLIMFWAYGTSVVKANHYAREEASSLGALILSYLVYVGVGVVSIAVILLLFVL